MQRVKRKDEETETARGPPGEPGPRSDQAEQETPGMSTKDEAAGDTICSDPIDSQPGGLFPGAPFSWSSPDSIGEGLSTSGGASAPGIYEERASRPGNSRIPGKDHRRYYHSHWRLEYLMDFNARCHSMICMVCGSSLATLKLSTIKRHIRQKHPYSLNWTPSEKEVIIGSWDAHLCIDAQTLAGTAGEEPGSEDPCMMQTPKKKRRRLPPVNKGLWRPVFSSELMQPTFPDTSHLEQYLNESLQQWFRVEFLMDYDCVGNQLHCMMCASVLPSLNLADIKHHILDTHPTSLQLSPSQKSVVLEAWANRGLIPNEEAEDDDVEDDDDDEEDDDDDDDEDEDDDDDDDRSLEDLTVDLGSDEVTQKHNPAKFKVVERENLRITERNVRSGEVLGDEIPNPGKALILEEEILKKVETKISEKVKPEETQNVEENTQNEASEQLKNEKPVAKEAESSQDKMTKTGEAKQVEGEMAETRDAQVPKEEELVKQTGNSKSMEKKKDTAAQKLEEEKKLKNRDTQSLEEEINLRKIRAKKLEEEVLKIKEAKNLDEETSRGTQNLTPQQKTELKSTENNMEVENEQQRKNQETEVEKPKTSESQISKPKNERKSLKPQKIVEIPKTVDLKQVVKIEKPRLLQLRPAPTAPQAVLGIGLPVLKMDSPTPILITRVSVIPERPILLSTKPSPSPSVLTPDLSKSWRMIAPKISPTQTITTKRTPVTSDDTSRATKPVSDTIDTYWPSGVDPMLWEVSLWRGNPGSQSPCVAFLPKWRTDYLVDYNGLRGNIVCMYCCSSLPALKESSFKRHITQKHPESGNFSAEERENIVHIWEAKVAEVRKMVEEQYKDGVPKKPDLAMDVTKLQEADPVVEEEETSLSGLLQVDGRGASWEFAFGRLQSNTRDPHRYEHDRWKLEYLMDYTPQKDGLICMVCGVTLLKPRITTVKMHIQQKHPDTTYLSDQEKAVVVEEWEQKLASGRIVEPQQDESNEICIEINEESSASDTSGSSAGTQRGEVLKPSSSKSSNTAASLPPPCNSAKRNYQVRWRTEFMMDYDCRRQGLICMVCGGTLATLKTLLLGL
uniref:SPIN-DOC-like zinc-finger domain-containing protein n=1 Tax=Leptobrachium leishanense TaxID=445787 RepID=A0A8C5R442_9ANUR